ncbi:RHS repeat protein [Serratia inhibens]|uniref:RHS repeat protein n=1 Tax=Serratia inhibens TaxID=2338073 RepID=A0AA92X947_9GAMM|nr:RHS repeat-associated core domain-containing protein [Serratia inhibens]RJF57567.1 RHS repeat protein [Serratia inhibens]
MNTSLFSKTPTVTVLDNRGLTVRTLEYQRNPHAPNVTYTHITRQRYDPRGFLSQCADWRQHEAGRVNFSYLTDLAGSVLRAQGADNGTTLSLSDIAGRRLLGIDANGVTRTWLYEDAGLPGRPLATLEQPDGQAARITERFVYADNADANKTLNLAGLCTHHYDTAGLVQTDSVALTGMPLSVTRRLLKDAENPDAVADWQGEDTSAWNDLLEGETHTSLTRVDATGTVLTTTDAKGHRQRVAYDVAGLLSGSWLTLKEGKEQVIVQSLTYSAAGQKLREEHGNGVVTTYTYEPQTQRLVGIKTVRPAGHAAGARMLQDLRYDYDPVGNVLSIRNDAEETRFWRNQKVVPENRFVYDSLYRLASASGREMANAGQQSTGLPHIAVPLPTDSGACTNYTRTYKYDESGNLTRISHSAPATGNNYSINITVSKHSNRGVLSTLASTAAYVDEQFTAGGQQKWLQPGQALVWTPRNELLQVTRVVRDGGTDDRESYRYDAGSRRILKVGAQKTGNGMQTQRALYLPGLEQRTTKSGETETESLQVITVGEAGRAQVRVLHWESGWPESTGNDQPRYSYDSLIGSSGLEVDGAGNIISLEEYYPYGGTAVWTARSQVEADYKTVRYSGKERDATGLYYYGYRYYQPWAGRWLSADPAGAVDGLNLFRMCRNNPVTLVDEEGLTPIYPISDERIDFEIKIAQDVLGEAIRKLNQQYLSKNTKEKIRAVFKTASREGKIKTSGFRSELLDRFLAMQESLRISKVLYDEEAALRKFAAYVYGNDKKRNIHISSIYTNKIGEVDNITTLLHEVSHFNDVKRSGKFNRIYKNEGSWDHYYTHMPTYKYSKTKEYIDEAISGFDDFYMSINPDKRVTKAGIKTSMLNLALENADHLAITALSLGQEKMKLYSETPSAGNRFVKRNVNKPVKHSRPLHKNH